MWIDPAHGIEDDIDGIEAGSKSVYGKRRSPFEDESPACGSRRVHGELEECSPLPIPDGSCSVPPNPLPPDGSAYCATKPQGRMAIPHTPFKERLSPPSLNGSGLPCAMSSYVQLPRRNACTGKREPEFPDSAIFRPFVPLTGVPMPEMAIQQISRFFKKAFCRSSTNRPFAPPHVYPVLQPE